MTEYAPLSPEAQAAIDDIVRRARETAGIPEPDRAKAALLDVVRRELACRWRDDRLDIAPYDQVVYGLGTDIGEADITVFHASGWVSVIDVRVGDRGVKHVGEGIRHVAAVARQVAIKCATSQVRCCLLWSSTGSVDEDVVLEIMCGRSGVIPLSWQELKVLVGIPPAIPDLPAAVIAELRGAH